MTSRSTIEIQVEPPHELDRRSKLFAALGSALGVSFVSGSPAPAAVVRFGDAGEPTGVPELVYSGPEEQADELVSNVVELVDDDSVDPLLRGRRIDDDLVRGAVVEAAGRRVVAATPQGPVWVRSGHRDETALAPAELDDGERLRRRLARRRFLGLLPLLELVRRVHPAALPRPPLRATFVFDDPNLHWPSYGFIRYAELAAHADRHRYHVNLAVIPLDCWHVSSRVARLVSENDRLSLVVHGNDHLKHELAVDSGSLDRVAAQAMGRIQTAARRRSLRFDPVMIPPHGKCSPAMMDSLRRAGFEAVAYWTPTGGELDRTLDGWAPADRHVGDGLPGLHRTKLSTPTADLVLRAYLGHPLVLYGHHEDVAGGLDVLAEAAARVRSVGPVTWSPLGEVVRGCVATRAEATRLVVTPFATRVELEVDRGVDELVIDPPVLASPAAPIEVRTSDGRVLSTMPGDVLDVRGVERVELCESRAGQLRPHLGRRRPWPLARRLLTEARDRAAPLVSGLAARRSRVISRAWG